MTAANHKAARPRKPNQLQNLQYLCKTNSFAHSKSCHLLLTKLCIIYTSVVRTVHLYCVTGTHLMAGIIESIYKEVGLKKSVDESFTFVELVPSFASTENSGKHSVTLNVSQLL